MCAFCPRRSDPFYIVSYYVERVTTSRFLNRDYSEVQFITSAVEALNIKQVRAWDRELAVQVLLQTS